jgi:hypothetical protein
MENWLKFILLLFSFGIIARFTDYIIYNCEYKCIIWFVLGALFTYVFNKIK